MRWQDWMNPLIGLWLVVAPLLMAYGGGFTGVAAWNSYLAGAALIVIPLMGLTASLPRREWLVLALGVWLVVAPFVLGFAREATAAWNTSITGVVVVVTAAAAIRAIGKGPRGA